MKLSGNTLLITGGSSGIGLALATVFVEQGNTVLICGRSEEKRIKAKRFTPELHTVQCDISLPEDQEALLEHLQTHFPDLNILINNAGMMQQLDLTNGAYSAEKASQEMTTNFLAPVDLTQRLLPLLQKQAQAAVINISSGLAYVPMASSPVYCASKAALHSYTQSLREQLKGSSIKVVEVLPPTVDTAMVRDLETKKLSPETFAKQVLRQLERDAREIRVGQAKALYTLSRVAPGFIYKTLNRAAH